MPFIKKRKQYKEARFFLFYAGILNLKMNKKIPPKKQNLFYSLRSMNGSQLEVHEDKVMRN